MRVLVKLLRAELLARKTRFVLTLLAVMAAACMVVWVVSGYDGLIKQFDAFADESQGRYGLTIVSTTTGSGPNAPATPLKIDDALLADLAKDDAVASVDAVSQMNATVTTGAPTTQRGGGGGRGAGRPGAATQPAGGRGGPAGGGRPPAVTLAGIDASVAPFEVSQGRWITAEGEVVVSSLLAKSSNISVGDNIGIGLPARPGERPSRRPIRVTVVGITQQSAAPAVQGQRGGPRVLGPAANVVYVSGGQYEAFAGNRDVNYVGLTLKEDADARGIVSRFRDRVSALSAAMQSPEDIEQSLETQGQANNLRQQSYAATGIAMLAALFIIFTTLGMGMSERIRQLAMLRSIAFTRTQVASLVMLEGLLLGLVGWVGGLFAGWLLLKVVPITTPVAIGPFSLLLTGACALGGALIASLVPAWQSTRITPLMAMKPAAPKLQTPRIAFVTVAGLMLIAINPLLVFVALKSPALAWLKPDTTRLQNIYLAIGVTTMAVGFILLAPLAIVLSEKLFGPLLAKLLALNPSLLTSQLRSNLWRTLGTTIALTIGLGLYASMQVWGYSMLNPFVPGDWAPEFTIAVLPDRVSDAGLAAIENIPAFEGGKTYRAEVMQPTLTGDPLHSADRNTVVRQNTIVLVGLDPKRAFLGDDKMLDLEFVQGNAMTATAALQSGQAIVIPDHFARELNVKLGSEIELDRQGENAGSVKYVVAGVVKLPGWHWLTKFNATRLKSGRSAAMTFASADQMTRDFPEGRSQFVFANPRNGVTQEMIENDAKPALSASEGVAFNTPQYPTGGPLMPGTDSTPTVRVTSTNWIRDRINGRADGMIWDMSKMCLVTLAVTSLGVVNAMLAAVRARQFEMGILRSVGYTRSALLRLVLAEAMLIGLVACVLSVSLGIMAGWCWTGIDQYTSFFGGLQPTLVVPIKQLSYGVGLAVGLCLLAALWPALQAGFTRPLQLLQAGRAAT